MKIRLSACLASVWFILGYATSGSTQVASGSTTSTVTAFPSPAIPLSKVGGGVYALIHTFGPNGSGDGQNPDSTVVVGASGNLYGTTATGGTGSGVAYQLKSPAAGRWFDGDRVVCFRLVTEFG